MVKRYLEIDSTYRDRTLWPNSASFQIPLSQSASHNGTNAVDPVSNAAPILEWTSNEFVQDVASTISISGNEVTNQIGNARSPGVLIMQSTGANELQTEDDYYRHAVIENANGDRARIVSYTYLGNDRGEFVLDPPLDDFTGPLVISDPTDLASRRVFVPTGENRENAYVGYLLYNETLNEYATITAYDPVTGLVTLDDDDDITGWLPSHRYSIRRSPPTYDTMAGAGSTTTEVNIGPQANSSLDTIVGSFIRVQQTTAVQTPPQNESRRIVAYDPNTNIATVYPPFTATTLNEQIEILPFSYDNYNPFYYSGSPQFEDAFYEIRLVSLTLPANVPLTTRYGGTVDSSTSSYYVELSDVANHNYWSPIYTNNPNSTRALFRTAYNNFDASDSSTREFVHFIGEDATQLMKFRVETNLRFRVFTREGETLTFDLPERFSPTEPERRIQITAMFEFQKSR